MSTISVYAQVDIDDVLSDTSATPEAMAVT